MKSAQALTLPSWESGHTLSSVPLAPESIGPALRLLRERAGLNQQQLEQRAGLGASSLSRYERGSERPSLPTLAAILNGLGVGFQDLGDAVDELTGAPRALRAGRPRREWVGVLRDMGISEPVLRGFAFEGYSSGVDVDRIEADLVASAQEAAREIAEAAASYRRAYDAEAALEVADGTLAPRSKRGEP